MRDRGEIKWAPFNSVINGKYIVSEIEKKKKAIGDTSKYIVNLNKKI